MLIYEKVAEIDSLLEQIKAEKQAGITEMKSELESALQEYQTSTSSALETQISQSQDSLKSEIETSLTQSIQSLESTNASTINQTLTDLASVTKTELKSELLESLESSDNLKVELVSALNESLPLELLANASFNAKVLESIEGAIESQMTEQRANRIFRRALQGDKLIKDYYESFLRLQSLKIFATQELIQGIIQAISKPSKPEPEVKPEPPEYQNVLIAR